MKIEDVFIRLKPMMGKKLDAIWREYIISDPKTQRLIENELRLKLAKNYKSSFEERIILLEPPENNISKGDYHLGDVFYGDKKVGSFGLKEDEIIQHTAIFGRSGSGKTNIAYLLILEFIRKRKPFLIFDWKRSYRDLLSLKQCRDLEIFTVGRNTWPFKFNPLIPPPGTPAEVWLKKLIEIINHVYVGRQGLATLLRKAIDKVYQDYGIYSGQFDQYPTFQDIGALLKQRKTKSRETSWMLTAQRAISEMCFGSFGEVLNTRSTDSFEKLLERNVVLELDALSDTDKTFLIETMLLWVHHYRLGQRDKEKFKHAILIEEAHHILLKKKQEMSGQETITDIILRESREEGEAIILLDQLPSLISMPALANTYCTIAMNLKLRSDLNVISAAMNMNSAKTKHLGEIDVGWGIVKLQGRYPRPFLVKFPLLKIKKGSVSDDDVEKHGIKKMPLPEFLKFGNRISSDLFEKLSSHVSTGNKAISIPNKPSKEVSTPSPLSDKLPVLGEKELEFLGDVYTYPYDKLSDRYLRLGHSWRSGNLLKNSLLSHNFIMLFPIKLPTGQIKLVELTDKGHKAICKQNKKGNRPGGLEHEYWKHRVAEHYKSKGYKVKKEYPIGEGKTVDVAAVKNGEKIAIEVETGKSDAEGNIRKCLDYGFEKVVCFVLYEKNISLKRMIKSTNNVNLMNPKVL